MDVRLRYVMRLRPNDWTDKSRGDAWFLCREIIGPFGTITEDKVAVFNLDSEAGHFMDFVDQGGQVMSRDARDHDN